MPSDRRGMNYTASEKEMLLYLVKEYPIILNKLTTTEVNQQKHYAWMEIAERYNGNATSGYRTGSQLRRLYDNLKQRIKHAGQGGFNENDLLESFTMKNVHEEVIKHKLEEINNVTPSTSQSACEESPGIAPCRPTAKKRGGEMRKNKVFKKEITCDDRKSQIRRILNYKEQYIKTKLDTARLEKQYMMQKQMLIVKLLKTKTKVLEGGNNCPEM